jgi:hypothetical protein
MATKELEKAPVDTFNQISDTISSVKAAFLEVAEILLF